MGQVSREDTCLNVQGALSEFLFYIESVLHFFLVLLSLPSLKLKAVLKVAINKTGDLHFNASVCLCNDAGTKIHGCRVHYDQQ